MVDYGRLLALGAREARRAGSLTVEPRHVLVAAVRHEDGPLASRFRELANISRLERPDTALDTSPTHLPVDQHAARLVALAAGWALARAASEPTLQDLLVAAAWGPDAPGVLLPADAGGIGVRPEDVVAQLRELNLAAPVTDPGPVDRVWPVLRVVSEHDAERLIEWLEREPGESPNWVLDESDALTRIHTEDAAALLRLAADLGIELQAEWADTANEQP